MLAVRGMVFLYEVHCNQESWKYKNALDLCIIYYIESFTGHAVSEPRSSHWVLLDDMHSVVHDPSLSHTYAADAQYTNKSDSILMPLNTIFNLEITLSNPSNIFKQTPGLQMLLPTTMKTNKHTSIDSAMAKEYQQKARHGKDKKTEYRQGNALSQTCISETIRIHQWNSHVNIMRAGINLMQVESTSFCHAFITISTRKRNQDLSDSFAFVSASPSSAAASLVFTRRAQESAPSPVARGTTNWTLLPWTL